MLKIMRSGYPGGKLMKTITLKIFIKKDIGKLRHDCEKLIEVEMSKSGSITLQNILLILSSILK